MIVVSVSGGKDSTATLLLALERYSRDEIRAVFADTGNEHEVTYQYVDYLERVTGIEVIRVKADFSDVWQRKIDYVTHQWPESLRHPKRKNQGTKTNPIWVYPEPTPEHLIVEIIENSLSVLEQGPTGVPFLDLCILKGRFPSRIAQFCTSELKVIPITNYTLDLIDAVGPIESWQGVRAEESAARAKLPVREDKGGGLIIYRPIHKWNVDDVFAIHYKHGIDPNPLYKQSMNRVGCMPCINCSKNELLEISKRFPEHIDRIEKWEKILCMTSKRQSGTFFAETGESKTAYQRGNIRQQVEWSKTLRGGKKYDLFAVFEEPLACSSAYGLCE